MQDPFNSAPAQDEAQTETPQQDATFDAPPPEAPKKAPAKKASTAMDALLAAPKVTNVVQASEGKVVLTFKGGSGFEAPWIVIHANDLDDALQQVSETEKLKELMERTQSGARYFAGLGPAKLAGQPVGGGQRGGNGGQRRGAPQQAKQPPAYAPAPPGDDWVYKSGTSARGPWEGWFPPYEQKDQHKPVFFKAP
ncbi:hypotheical protein [Mycobacterium phage PP]|uniref:Hypotheical protein n=1 Tax=Mycobacterium phage PP TaxID=2077134 RepID=A0A2Z5XVH3_9CAUD|nr:ribonucleoside reductase class II [Mycobacterium phage PP]BBC53845.1 hypotheical protein [Mycobacterium phage PP]